MKVQTGTEHVNNNYTKIAQQNTGEKRGKDNIGIYAFIYLPKWRSGEVSTQLFIKYKSGALVTQFQFMFCQCQNVNGDLVFIRKIVKR